MGWGPRITSARGRSARKGWNIPFASWFLAADTFATDFCKVKRKKGWVGAHLFHWVPIPVGNQWHSSHDRKPLVKQDNPRHGGLSEPLIFITTGSYGTVATQFWCVSIIPRCLGLGCGLSTKRVVYYRVYASIPHYIPLSPKFPWSNPQWNPLFMGVLSLWCFIEKKHRDLHDFPWRSPWVLGFKRWNTAGFGAWEGCRGGCHAQRRCDAQRGCHAQLEASADEDQNYWEIMIQFFGI